MNSKSLLAAPLIAAVVIASSVSASAAPLTLGANVTINGLLGGNPVSGSIYDKDIHSGVFRNVNAFPSASSGPVLMSDSYVLQGGHPNGNDTADDFEVSQAHGHAVLGGLDIETGYDYGQPSNQAGTFIFAAPDTGWVRLINNTAMTYSGLFRVTGQAFGGIYGPAQFFSNGGNVTLGPGADIYLVLNNESSNYGGYNHPDATPDGGSTTLLLGGALALVGAARRKMKA